MQRLLCFFDIFVRMILRLGHFSRVLFFHCCCKDSVHA